MVNNSTYNNDVNNRRKDSICNRVLKITPQMIADKLCNYKMEDGYGWVYFASADDKLSKEVELMLTCTGLKILSRVQLKGFLKAREELACLQMHWFEEILALVEQFLLSESTILLYSKESTFSNRIKANSKATHKYDVLSVFE